MIATTRERRLRSRAAAGLAGTGEWVAVTREAAVTADDEWAAAKG